MVVGQWQFKSIHTTLLESLSYSWMVWLSISSRHFHSSIENWTGWCTICLYLCFFFRIFLYLQDAHLFDIFVYIYIPYINLERWTTPSIRKSPSPPPKKNFVLLWKKIPCPGEFCLEKRCIFWIKYSHLELEGPCWRPGKLLEICCFCFLVVGNGWDFSYELLICDWFDRKT